MSRAGEGGGGGGGSITKGGRTDHQSAFEEQTRNPKSQTLNPLHKSEHFSATSTTQMSHLQITEVSSSGSRCC